MLDAEFNYLAARFYSRIKLFRIPPNITNIRVSEQFRQNEIVLVRILIKCALEKTRPFDVVESFELNGEKFEVR